MLTKQIRKRTRKFIHFLYIINKTNNKTNNLNKTINKTYNLNILITT